MSSEQKTTKMACTGYGQPPEKPRTESMVVSKMALMSEKAAQGCLSCSILLAGIEKSLEPGDPNNASVKIEFNWNGVKGLQVTIFGIYGLYTGPTIAFYSSECCS